MAAHCFDATTFVGPCNHKARGQHHNPPAPGRSHYLKIKRKQVCNKFFIGMKRIHTILIILLLAVTYGEAKKSSDDRQMDDFITSLMKKMTLEEKIGQLNLGGVGSPKVVGSAIGLDEAIRKGLVSSVGGFDAKAAEDAQKFAVENSRMKIPLIDYRARCRSRILYDFPHTLGQCMQLEHAPLGRERTGRSRRSIRIRYQLDIRAYGRHLPRPEMGAYCRRCRRRPLPRLPHRPGNGQGISG